MLLYRLSVSFLLICHFFFFKQKPAYEMCISDWSSDVCTSDLIIGLAFRLYDPDGLIGDTNDIGITIALVPRDTDGVDIGRRHFPLNSPFQNGPIHGREVFIPLSQLLGGEDYAG